MKTLQLIYLLLAMLGVAGLIIAFKSTELAQATLGSSLLFVSASIFLTVARWERRNQQQLR
jgi:uncharacterized membrane protein